jgi:hypothetical protein
VRCRHTLEVVGGLQEGAHVEVRRGGLVGSPWARGRHRVGCWAEVASKMRSGVVASRFLVAGDATVQPG